MPQAPIPVCSFETPVSETKSSKTTLFCKEFIRGNAHADDHLQRFVASYCRAKIAASKLLSEVAFIFRLAGTA
jgi:hypothetical protein